MKTWEDYKEYISSLSDELKADVEEACALASFVTQEPATADLENP